MKLTEKIIPKHIGIILDGNRRYAEKMGINPLEGHEVGYEKVKKTMDWCKELAVKELTVYTFSTENFARPKKEVSFLMKLFEKAFKELRDDKKKLKELRIRFIGRISMFSRTVQKIMNELMDITINNGPYTINFAMGYGGRSEIVDATKKIIQQVKDGKLDINDINEENFKKNLYLQSYPDLIIRTSESRLSGFLMYQSAYSEIIFLPDKLWPEFEKDDLIKCIEEFSRRNRRFGK